MQNLLSSIDQLLGSRWKGSGAAEGDGPGRLSRAYRCRCGAHVFFRNSLCLKCGTPLGYLPSYYTGTGFRMVPVVALVAPEAPMVANPDEVERVFETPLSVLFDMRRYRMESRMWEGKPRRYYVLDHSDAYIWGATAAVIRILYERLIAE